MGGDHIVSGDQPISANVQMRGTNMGEKIILKSPLFTEWGEQYVGLWITTGPSESPVCLQINGVPADFQYTGETSDKGHRALMKIGFAAGETKTLEFVPAKKHTTKLSRAPIPLARSARIGLRPACLTISAPKPDNDWIVGPFRAFAGFPMKSRFRCDKAFAGASLERLNDGPLFTDYELAYRFEQNRAYVLKLRCFKKDPIIEVSERFSLHMNAAIEWHLNPKLSCDSILSHRGPEFEGEPQPVVEHISVERPADVLCRLQMPVLSEYFVPNNRGWFAFFNSRDEESGMFGILGLYGARWERPVENMPEVRVAGGKAVWHASLASGRRHWLLYYGPVEREYTAKRRFVFHRLHAEINAMRLDEHFDLGGDRVFDADSFKKPGVIVGDDYHERAKMLCDALPPLRKALAEMDEWSRNNKGGHFVVFDALVNPTPENQKLVYEYLTARFEKWVRQFQGWRTGQYDYQKNVIGFSRWLRSMLIGYELLRKDQSLTADEIRKLNAYFVFAARRITDEGRWPHSRTFLHPDHPESSRDFYTYGGEHKPDRLVWTNCLPNFQSDPLCALAHLSAIFQEHPDSRAWLGKGVDEIERQLNAYMGRSGAWEESINYALYTFSYFVITFRALKYRWGLDYFNDERVRRFAAWLCRFFGPVDKRFGVATWPGIGNAVLPTCAGHYLLCYAAELPEDDPLREQCIAVYQAQEDHITLSEHYPHVLALMGFVPREKASRKRLESEHMDELGVAMRHEHLTPKESYLFQKIGFWKDHYEGDESAFNWYAKGTPFTMDYGTYTPDVAPESAHNLVEIPDSDNLRRGYLANVMFSPVADYTHCEIPVTLKLLWGHVRSFEECDSKDGKVDRMATKYFYIGDKNPVGPKVWKVRMLLFVKPDYLALFDRVYGDVPHRFNLHFTGTNLRREGSLILGDGRFDLDLMLFIQAPNDFKLETGRIIPNYRRKEEPEAALRHAQEVVRIYNQTDGMYRTLIFAREKGREVAIQRIGRYGIAVRTNEYEDRIWMHNDTMEESGPDWHFVGRVGWIRHSVSGRVTAMLADGEEMASFGASFRGRGPWVYNADGKRRLEIKSGPPRRVEVAGA